MASRYVLEAPEQLRPGTVVPTYGEVVRVDATGRVKVKSKRAKEVLERRFGFKDFTVEAQLEAPARRAIARLKGLDEAQLAEAERWEKAHKARKTVLRWLARQQRKVKRKR